MKSCRVLFFFFCVLCSSTSLSALELLNADGNSNRFVDGGIVSTLWGTVTFFWNNTTIISDTTVWQRRSGDVRMTGNIRVLRDEQELLCDSASFLSDGNVLQLRGKISAVDRGLSTSLFAGEVDYFVDTDSVVLRYDPRVSFSSEDSDDTVSIVGEKMVYLSKTGAAQACDSVRIFSSEFVCHADTGYYFSETERGLLVGNPRLTHEEASIVGDSIHIFFEQEQLESFTVVGDPTGHQYEVSNGDTTVTTLQGDTLRFELNDGNIETIYTERNATFQRSSKATEDFPDRIWGDRIVTVLDTGGIGGVSRASGKARAQYRDAESRNEVVGDTIIISFDTLSVYQVGIIGAVQGILIE